MNYVALLGWSPDSNQEIFSLEDLVREFDYHRINKSPSVFDMNKLKWMNGEYLKAMDAEEFQKLVTPYIKEVVTRDLDLSKICPLVQTRMEILPDVKELVDFFEKLPEYDAEMYCHKKMKTNLQNSLEILTEEYELLKDFDDWSLDALHDKLMEYIAGKEIKNGTGLWPIRTAVSGKQSTPGGAFEIMEILGKEESLRRMQTGIQKLQEAQTNTQ